MSGNLLGEITKNQYPPSDGIVNTPIKGNLPAPVPLIHDFSTDLSTVCPACGYAGPSKQKKRMGTAACAWCWVLALTTFVLWIVPVCCDYCKDTQLRCEKCGAKKGVVKGECC